MILCLVDDDPVSLEALTFASRLGEAEALIFGEANVDGYVPRARRVLHDRLDEYAPDAWAQTPDGPPHDYVSPIRLGQVNHIPRRP